jgi:mono/diheme cytochrome c family protein
MKPSLRAPLLLGAVAASACVGADAATGEQLFAQCVACHGPKAAGNPTQAPAIAGQRAAYVSASCRMFVRAYAASISPTHKARRCAALR